MNAFMKNVLLSLVALTGLLLSNLASAHEEHDMTLSFMSGLNDLLDGLILNRTPHVRAAEPWSLWPTE